MDNLDGAGGSLCDMSNRAWSALAGFDQTTVGRIRYGDKGNEKDFDVRGSTKEERKFLTVSRLLAISGQLEAMPKGRLDRCGC